MEDKNIFNVYVVMDSQANCDRMKQVCVENDLNDNIYESDFEFSDKYRYFLSAMTGFYVASQTYSNSKVTEQEFLQLLKEYKNV